MASARKNPGGRPPNDNEYLWARISRATRVDLDRYAKKIGIKKEKWKPYWDTIFRSLLKEAEIPQPEYLKLANSIRPSAFHQNGVRI